MALSIYINTALGSCLTIMIIALDYIRKFNVDLFQRKLLLSMLAAAFVSVLTDFVSHIVAGIPGPVVHAVMYATISLFLVAQNCAYYLGVVFIDYFAYGSAGRSKKIIRAVCVFLLAYTAGVIANLPLGYYFAISADNFYAPGKLFFLRLLLGYSAMLMVIIDIFLARKQLRRSQAYLIIFFLVLTGTGAALDVAFKTSSLTWPCFAASALYLYFFIIQADAKLDSLTGIGNRYSFNEFINKLSRQNSGEDYSIAMIDLDRFKEINDTLGHLEGDHALRDMAEIIKGCIRYSDFAARYGGDEFVLATKAESGIQRLLDRIQEAIDRQNQRGLRPYQLYMSYGYDVYATHASWPIKDFMAHIDALMYKHKEERRRNGIGSVITGKKEEKNV
jgi:diguanylate cyclase (GGDEF)-like protein